MFPSLASAVNRPSQQSSRSQRQKKSRSNSARTSIFPNTAPSRDHHHPQAEDTEQGWKEGWTRRCMLMNNRVSPTDQPTIKLQPFSSQYLSLLCPAHERRPSICRNPHGSASRLRWKHSHTPTRKPNTRTTTLAHAHGVKYQGGDDRRAFVMTTAPVDG